VPDEARFVNRVRDVLALEEDDSLWLASGAPQRWLAPGQKIQVHDLATYFGPVSYEIEGALDRVDATVQLPSRNPYKDAWLVTRVPGAARLASVEIDGKPWTDFDAVRQWVRLPKKTGQIKVTVRF
jgi:hypothetical protein